MNFGHGEILFKQGINIPTGIPVAHTAMRTRFDDTKGGHVYSTDATKEGQDVNRLFDLLKGSTPLMQMPVTKIPTANKGLNDVYSLRYELYKIKTNENLVFNLEDYKKTGLTVGFNGRNPTLVQIPLKSVNGFRAYYNWKTHDVIPILEVDRTIEIIPKTYQVRALGVN